LDSSDDGTTWEGSPDATTDDIAFTSDLLDLIESEFCIDTDHVYATGKSQGGGFVGRLACDADLSTRFAAFAPVSGAYYNTDITKKSTCFPLNMTIPCDSARSDIPIIAFHGGADDTVNYFGEFRKSACLPYIPHWVKHWVSHNDLSSVPTNTSISGSKNGTIISFGDGLVKLVYDGDNIPHDWPSTFYNSDNKGDHLTAFNATTMIMEFFNDHSLS
jgi:poly(3-hydroxybutyrate) depolymerase